MAAIKINFDTNYNPLVPTFILGDRMGNRYGIIENATNINVSDKMNDCPEVSFTVYKYINNEQCHLWDKIKDLMTVYCPEWNTWFEMSIGLTDESDILKNVMLVRLAEAELSQISLYYLEANSEDDLEFREEGETTILYDEDNPSCSLLHRMLDKAPHYSIAHVDSTIASIQREFSFDKVTIRDAFTEISEEINCIFTYDTADEDGNLIRTISVYDLENNCLECGYRGEFTDKCPDCGSTRIKEGYGEDTNIYVSSDGLGNSVSLEVDKDSIKNCFRLEAGDDIMTDTIKMCSPNNTLYLWNFSEYMKGLMPEELRNKYNDYIKKFDDYNKANISTLDASLVTSYNDLITKYKGIDTGLEHDKITASITGYSNLINIYYDVMDMEGYLESTLMPSVTIDGTTAEEQMVKLLESISKIALDDLSSATKITAKSAILSYAKLLVDGRYIVDINDDCTYNTSTHVWSGTFTITNISDEEDTYTSSEVNITIKADRESFIKQELDKLLNTDAYDTSISWLFNLEKCDLTTFTNELKKYGLNSLSSFETSCQACIDMMTSKGLNTNKTSSEYTKLVKPYNDRMSKIRAEIKVRESELDTIYDLWNDIEIVIDEIHIDLDIANYFGNLYPILCSYIREDEYSNPNYVSDGLSNVELVEKAKEFIAKAEKELYKASALQHNISADMKNLLTIKEFYPLVQQFQCGNWIRVRVDDEIFKLRLLEFDINYDDYALNVVFSDVTKVFDGITDLKSVISQTSSIAGSFDSFKSQMEKAAKKTKYIDNWVSGGIEITNVNLMSNSFNQNISWDKNGLLCRELDPITGQYKPQQLKLITNGLYLTEDDWQTSKTGIGKFTFYNPMSKKNETRYGVSADAIVGNLMLSETLGIYNEANNIILNKDGFTITNGATTVSINPNDVSVFSIKSGNDNVISMDSGGNLTIIGRIQAVEGSDVTQGISGLSDVAFSGNYEDLNERPSLSNVALTGKYEDLNERPSLSNVALTGKYDDLSGTPTLSSVALTGKYSDLNDRPSLSNVALSGKYSDLNEKPSLSNVALSGKYNDLTGAPDLSDVALSGNYGDLNNKPSLSDVALSGDYDDLSGKPDLSKYLTSNDMAIYISKDGVVGSTPSNGATGFKVSKSGLLEASNAIIYGTIYASYGKIGNWTLADGYLANNATDSDGSVYTTIIAPSSNLSTGTCFMVRKVTSSGSTTYPFFVRPSGHLHAEDVQISGEVVASTGKIGGFTISGKDTASNGFWNWALSSVVNTSTTVNASNPQYAVFMRGQSDDGKSGAISPENVVFGVKKRTATSTSWNDASYMFYVRADGLVRCSNFIVNGNATIYNKLYMANTGDEKCEIISFSNADYYSNVSIGTGCYGIQFKSIEGSLGEARYGVNSAEWTFNGDVFAEGNVRMDGFVEAIGGGVFGDDIGISGAVECDNVITPKFSLNDPYNNVTKSAIRYVTGTSDGLGMSIGAGGLVAIGSGESADNYIKEESLPGEKEALYLTSDANIYLATKCNTISEKKELVFTDTNIFRPTVNQGWAVGSSTYRFTNGYFTTVYNSSGSITNSDARLKKDFTEIPNSEEFIMSLKPTQYKYIDGNSDRNHWGFIAQEVKESLDNICKTDCGLYIEDVKGEDSKPLSECTYEEKELGLRYEELIAPHIYVTQKHNKEINALKEEISQLKQIINTLMK